MVCESCNERIAMVTVEFNDGERFRVCTGCLAEDDSKRDPKYRVVKVFEHDARAI